MHVVLDEAAELVTLDIEAPEVVEPSSDRPTRTDAEVAEIVAKNRRLVGKLIMKYGLTGRGVDLEDLMQSGTIGLIEAARRYDPSRGFRFSTFAVPWITRHLFEAVSGTGKDIRIPRKTAELVNKVSRRLGEMASALGRQPSLDEVCDDLRIPAGYRRRVAEALVTRDATAHGAEAAALIPEDAGDPVGVAINGEQLGEYLGRIRAAVQTLTPRQRDVVTLHYGLNGGKPMPLRNVATALGFSKDWCEAVFETACESIKAELADLAESPFA